MAARLMEAFQRQFVFPVILWWRGERSMYSELARLRELEDEAPDATRERQRKKLAAILDYASLHSPFYRGRLGENGQDPTERLRSAPILTKTLLQREFERLKAVPAPSRISRKTTGGSTGQPVTVLKDAEAIAAERAATWLGHGWFGLRVGDRGARFWGSPRTLGHRRLRFALADLAMNRIRFSAFGVTDESLAHYFERCMAYKPRYFYGYVSMLERFARYVQSNGLDGTRIGVKCIVTTSEALTNTQRDLLVSVFGARVQNEYGCGEVGPIAYECPNGSLHIMSENVLVELVDENGEEVALGEEGSVVVTDLNNRAMPLIRYRLEDRAVRGRGCECGRGFPVLSEVRGRQYDFVETPHGKAFHGEFFMYLFEDLRESGLPIGCFRVVQASTDRLQIEVQAPRAEAEIIRGAVQGALSRQLGMYVEVDVVEDLKLSDSGKLRVIENRVLQGAAS